MSAPASRVPPGPCIDGTYHHWMLTQRNDGPTGRVIHHRCLKCDAEKDVPVNITESQSRWTSKRIQPTL